MNIRQGICAHGMQSYLHCDICDGRTVHQQRIAADMERAEKILKAARAHIELRCACESFMIMADACGWDGKEIRRMRDCLDAAKKAII